MTADLLDKVLARDILNIQKRVAAGEPITSAEREVLKQARGAGNAKEPTQAALARALGIHRQRLHRGVEEAVGVDDDGAPDD